MHIYGKRSEAYTITCHDSKGGGGSRCIAPPVIFIYRWGVGDQRYWPATLRRERIRYSLLAPSDAALGSKMRTANSELT
jgi:hypothetical protein